MNIQGEMISDFLMILDTKLQICYRSIQASFVYKVDVPKLVTYLNQTPIFEWCGSKNEYPKDMCI